MGERDRPAIERPRLSDRSREASAAPVTTEPEWSDLGLPPSTVEQLREVETEIRADSSTTDDSGLSTRHRSGYKCLFHGPPGTGKTMAATALGRRLGQQLHRIELTRVVEKYIGETEKNLDRAFERVEQLDRILFFDEADALFGAPPARKHTVGTPTRKPRTCCSGWTASPVS